MERNKLLFCEGVYASVVNTKYGELINLKIDIDKLRRNLTLKDEQGRECLYAQIKTNKDGGKYVIINTYKYHNKDSLNNTPIDDSIPF